MPVPPVVCARKSQALICQVQQAPWRGQVDRGRVDIDVTGGTSKGCADVPADRRHQRYQRASVPTAQE